MCQLTALHRSIAALLLTTTTPALAVDLDFSPSTTGGLIVDLIATPNPTADDVIVTDSPIISRRIPGGVFIGNFDDASLDVYEFDTPVFNPDGLFGTATLSGSAAANNFFDTGVRAIAPRIIAGDGVVTSNDGFATPLVTPNFKEIIRFDPAVNNFAPFSLDVDSALRVRATDGTGEGGIALVLAPGSSFDLAPSIAADVTLSVTDYFQNPIDAAPVITQDVGFSFRGQAGDFVTQGETQLFEGDEVSIRFSDNFDNGVNASISTPIGNFRLEFAAPGDAQLQPGDSFTGTRIPFQDAAEAGFAFSGRSRNNNQLTAEFTILDIAYNLDGEVILFDATFLQRGDQDRTAVGRLRFIPEPTTAALTLSLGLLALSRRRSF